MSDLQPVGDGYYYDSISGIYYYYDETTGDYIPYNQNAAIENGTDDQYKRVYVNGMELIIDDRGRILDPLKLESTTLDDDIPPEDYHSFTSEWQKIRIVSKADGKYASKIVWPNENEVVFLKRFDLYESKTKTCHFGTSDIEESRLVRFSGEYTTLQTIFFFSHSTPLTIELEIGVAILPKRSRFKPKGSNNLRDLGKWVQTESVNGLVTTTGFPGTATFHVEWTDCPDRYIINQSEAPRNGWRRLFRFAAYPASQYYILSTTVEHEVLGSEGGSGFTCDIFKGPSVFARRGWRIIGSFFAFDYQLPSSIKYTVYTRQDPFHRMSMTMENTIANAHEWTEQFSFYAFDVPVAGTCPYQLQHCIRSIHTTDASVSRHRVTTLHAALPWQHRYDFYVFPGYLEDTVIEFEEC